MPKQHKDGTTTFFHAMLASVIAHPDKKEVLSLSEEPIIQQDGFTKNDCELNAAKRLVTKVQTRFLSDRFIWVQDALYSNGPHIRNIQSKGHRFITRVKKGSLLSCFGAENAMPLIGNNLSKVSLPPIK